MVAYLNELSLPILHSEIDVVNAFGEFGEYYQRARACGIREIKIQESFFSFHFCNGYTFYEWLRDNRADEDLRILFKSVFGTVPFVEEIFNSYQEVDDTPLEMHYQDRLCIGLGLSSDKIFNTISFSFDPPNWSLANYTISVTATIENENGDIIDVTQNAIAKNIATLDHLGVHQKFINDQIAVAIPNGRELWIRKADLFPNLQFCDSVEPQIMKINARNIEFQQIVNRLFDLQNAAVVFNGKPIEPEDFPTKTTPESAGRIQRLGVELTFTCPDGQPRLFHWHSRYTPGAGRIHFFPFENEQRILIGYIGLKIQ